MNAATRKLSLIGIAALLTHCSAADQTSSSGAASGSADGNTVAKQASANDTEGKAADARNGLTALAGTQRIARSGDIVADAKAYAASQASTIGAVNATFSGSAVATGIDGVQHVRLSQTHNGVKVFGADVVVHADDSEVINVAGAVALQISVDMSPSVDQGSILALAKTERFGTRAVKTTSDASEKVIYIDAAGVQHLAFHSSFNNEADTDLAPARWNHVFDAQTGKLLARWNALQSVSQASGPGGNAKYNHPWTTQLDVNAQGSGYVMTTTPFKTVDLKHGTSTQSEVTSTSLTFSDAVINDAHGYAEMTLGVMSMFGHNSIDDNGFQIISRVHYSTNYENAFWDGSTMTYGDGASTFYPLSGALDVCAHEIHHGFTEKHSGLAYSGEPGGLNEGFSDIAGKTAQWMNEPEVANFNVGDQVFKAPNEALRYMCDPPSDGSGSIGNAADMTSSLDPHYSSGVPNKWFCLASKRFSSANLDDSTGTATQAGVKRAAQAIYLANAHYWTSSTSFIQACQGTVDAAKSLAYSDAEVSAIKASWRDVGVYCDGDVAPPPPCDETLNTATGTITSPNYPSNYPDNYKHTTCIDAPAGKQVTLTFTDFTTEAGYDYVSLGTSTGAIQSKTAGTTKPAPITSSRVYVIFTSDSSANKKGWSAGWTTN